MQVFYSPDTREARVQIDSLASTTTRMPFERMVAAWHWLKTRDCSFSAHDARAENGSMLKGGPRPLMDMRGTRGSDNH